MSPTGIFAVLLLALVIDGMSIGSEAIRDRIAFCLGLAAIREGWDGSPVDTYTVAMLTAWIEEAKKTGNATLAQASTAALLGILVGLLAIYCVGVLMPAKWSAKAGQFATLSFRKGGGGAARVGPPGAGTGGKFRLNGRLWLCAYLLGLMAELPSGIIGSLVLGAVTGLVNVVAPLPNVLFGVS